MIKEDKCKCKLYHTTKKSTYENIIKKEGLKYVHEKEKKTLECENGIYFKLSKNNAIDFGHDSFFDKEFVVLETDILDVLDVCKSISKSPDNDILASPKINKSGVMFGCNIPPDKIKVVFDSRVVKNKSHN